MRNAKSPWFEFRFEMRNMEICESSGVVVSTGAAPSDPRRLTYGTSSQHGPKDRSGEKDRTQDLGFGRKKEKVSHIRLGVREFCIFGCIGGAKIDHGGRCANFADGW